MHWHYTNRHNKLEHKSHCDSFGFSIFHFACSFVDSFDGRSGPRSKDDQSVALVNIQMMPHFRMDFHLPIELLIGSVAIE